MARARNIKPGFFKNEDLIELSAFHRLLFIGLWTLADRNGVLEDRPRRIKLELLPCDSFDVEAVLSDLAERGFILRYSADGFNLIHIKAFAKHQNPHHTEKTSGLPSPPEIHGEVTVNPPLDNGEYPADSLIHRFTDSLIPDSVIQEPAPASQARPPAAPRGAAPLVEIRKPAPPDLEDRIRALANQAPDPQYFEAGVNRAAQEIAGSGNPEATIAAMEENLPLWFAAMLDGRAKMRPLMYLITDRDYLRKPAAKARDSPPKVQGFKRPQDAVWDRMDEIFGGDA